MSLYSTKRSGDSKRAIRRRAYILVVVLGFTAVASALGLAFLDSTSTVMPEAVNYKGLVRAQYLAGSGVGMAGHYLMYYPTSVSLDSYWTGANNVSLLSGSPDYFNVSVLRSDGWSPAQSDPFLFRITSTGVAADPDGTVRAKKTVTADVIAPPKGLWVIPHAVVCRNSISFSSVSRINGDAYANGNLSGTGWCTGNLSAAGTCIWTGTGPPTSLTSSASVLSPLPSASPTRYSTFTIQGKSYSAYVPSISSDITQADANYLNSVNMSATNPGRVIKLLPNNIRLRQYANVNGTLVVTGRLELDDAGSRSITAVAGFPALVVTGDIKVLSNDATFTVNGAVICGGGIDNNNKDRVNLTFNGPLIVLSGAVGTKSTTVLNYNYTPSRATFWDFENAAPLRPITCLNWKEN